MHDAAGRALESGEYSWPAAGALVSRVHCLLSKMAANRRQKHLLPITAPLQARACMPACAAAGTAVAAAHAAWRRHELESRAPAAHRLTPNDLPQPSPDPQRLRSPRLASATSQSSQPGAAPPKHSAPQNACGTHEARRQARSVFAAEACRAVVAAAAAAAAPVPAGPRRSLNIARPCSHRPHVERSCRRHSPPVLVAPPRAWQRATPSRCL